MIVREYASIVYELTRRVRQGNGQRLRQTHRPPMDSPVTAPWARCTPTSSVPPGWPMPISVMPSAKSAVSTTAVATLPEAQLVSATHEPVSRTNTTGCMLPARPVEKQRADGARLRRGGNGTLHERIVRLRAIHDKVR